MKKTRQQKHTKEFLQLKQLEHWDTRDLHLQGGGFRTVGAGKSFGNSGLAVSKSRYFLIGDVGKMFSKYVNKIKAKAKRFFKK